MSEHTRRRLLRATGVGAVAAVAGCLGGGDENDGENDGDGDDENGSTGVDANESQSASETLDGTILGGIDVENLAEQSHAVDVIVEVDGEIQHWSSHDLDASESGVSLERDWPDGSTFRVTVRLDGEEFWHRTPESYNDPDCVDLTVLIGRDDAVSIPGESSDACGE